MHAPDPAKMLAARESALKPQANVRNRFSNQTSIEKLGTQVVNGIPATGTRSIRTIPAGEEGNLQQMESVREFWMSQELGLMVRSVSDDPRFGRRVTEVEQIQKGEPDPSLFAMPTGTQSSNRLRTL
jgi:hypothetical protein